MVMKLSGNPVTKGDGNKYLKTVDGVVSLSAKGQTLVDDIMAFLTGNEDKLFAYKDIVVALAADKPLKYADLRNREVKSVMPFLMEKNPTVVDDGPQGASP